MSRRSLVLALAAALVASRAVGADDAAEEKRLRDAFKPIKLSAAAKIEKDVTPSLPQGIVTDAGPFEAVIKKLLAPFEPQLVLREDTMAKVGAATDAVAAVVAATSVMETENAELAHRVADVETMYGEVWAASYMESSEKTHRARKLAAVLIPFYRTLAARNAGVAQRAAEALVKGADAARTTRLVAAATGDPAPAVRSTAVAALGRIGGAEARAALTNVRAGDAVPAVRTKALAALCSFKAAEVKDAVIAALADSAWEVRALAAAICVRAQFVEAAGPLVLALAKEDGRLRVDFDDALHALVGVRFYGDAALWKKWWAENEATVTKNANALAANGAYEKPIGAVETWEQPDVSAEDAEKAKHATSSFYGISTASKRILFVVDISFSMADAAGARPPAPTGTSKDAYPAPAGGSKMDIARWQLHRAVAALPKDAAFDFVLFSESYKLWQPEMQEATDKVKAKAHEFVDSIKENGTTNICDPLEKAFELAAAPSAGGRSKGARSELGADTVFLMTDGNPNRGRLSDGAAILEAAIVRNRTARLVFHTIGIGEAAGSTLLQALAKRTGGQYVGFR